MGNRATFKVTGFKNLRHLVHQYGQDVTEAALADVSETVFTCAQRTRAAAPVADGELQNSITATVRTDGYTIKGKVRVKAKYASFLEFGTEEVNKHPHLVPAAIAKRKEMQRRIARTLVAQAPRELGKPSIKGRDSSLPPIHIE